MNKIRLMFSLFKRNWNKYYHKKFTLYSFQNTTQKAIENNEFELIRFISACTF